MTDITVLEHDARLISTGEPDSDVEALLRGLYVHLGSGDTPCSELEIVVGIPNDEDCLWCRPLSSLVNDMISDHTPRDGASAHDWAGLRYVASQLRTFALRAEAVIADGEIERDDIEPQGAQAIRSSGQEAETVSLSECAARLGVCYSNAGALVARGLVRAQKHGGRWRVPVTEVDRFMVQNASAPASPDAPDGRSGQLRVLTPQGGSMAKHMSTREAAAYLSLSPSSLEKFRTVGNGPAYVKVGSKVLYLDADLDAWIASRPRHGSTAEYVSHAGPGRPRQARADSTDS